MADGFETIRRGLAERYRIQRELGRGGMATVYLAEDLKHRRLVAIKVLQPKIATALGPERFLREIELTGQLRHPNILPLYDSGRVGAEVLYYVMPYVEGESLRERLVREKQLPLQDALRITRDVAEALGYAHSRGVIHRDIKPENILLESGQAVVADFGIAKALTAAGGERLTETGLAIGTPVYMSPEQTIGVDDLDARSDLYSLGTVLYEMLAGDPPFTGPTPQAILARKSVDAIPSLRAVRESVSPEIERAVLTALAKAPADRFQTVSQFADALSERESYTAGRAAVWRARPRRAAMVAGVGLLVAVAFWLLATRGNDGPIAVDANLVAVWPFEIVAPDTSLEYLREGAVHSVHGILTGDGLPQSVDPRTVLSAWGRAGLDRGVPSPTDLGALARRLGAGQMLLGSVISDPRQLTIRASLRRVADGKTVADYSVSGTRDSVFVLLERAILGLLGVAVGEGGAGRAGRLAEHPPAAVRPYLAGQRLLRQGDIENAARRFEEALATDSTFALAALAHLSTGDIGGGFSEASRQRVWALRDRLPDRDRALLVAVEDIGPRFPAIPTRRELLDAARAAVAANPTSVPAWRLLATRLAQDGALLGIVDWPEQAWRAFERVTELDSTDVLAASYLLELALAGGDPDVIERFGALFQRIAPRHPYADAYRWWVATELGDSGRVAEERSRFAEFSDISVNSMDRISIVRGYPLTDAVRAFEARTSHRAIDEDMRWIYAWGYVEIAFAQGRVAHGLRYMDSVVVAAAANPAVFSPLRVTTASYLVAQSLVEPGFDDPAARAAARLSALADTTGDADATCYAEMWRLSRGDTSRVRGTLERLREHGSAWDGRINYPFFGVGTGRTCVAFLQTQLAQLGSGTVEDGALERLESHLLEGSYELPGNIANLMLARWHASRGALAEALAALARRPSAGPPMTLIMPAWIREEGRLAAAAGDTARAVRAYRHYLALRSDPDPGALMDEVERVRAELRALQQNAQPPAAAWRRP